MLIEHEILIKNRYEKTGPYKDHLIQRPTIMSPPWLWSSVSTPGRSAIVLYDLLCEYRIHVGLVTKCLPSKASKVGAREQMITTSRTSLIQLLTPSCLTGRFQLAQVISVVTQGESQWYEQCEVYRSVVVRVSYTSGSVMKARVGFMYSHCIGHTPSSRVEEDVRSECEVETHKEEEISFGFIGDPSFNIRLT